MKRRLLWLKAWLLTLWSIAYLAAWAVVVWIEDVLRT